LLKLLFRIYRNRIMDLLNSAAEAVSNAADAVSNAVSGGVLAANCKIAEQEIEKHTGRKIEVDYEGIPDGQWLEWKQNRRELNLQRGYVGVP